jgi:hypothetical protein
MFIFFHTICNNLYGFYFSNFSGVFFKPIIMFNYAHVNTFASKSILMHFIPDRLFTQSFLIRVHNFLACFILGKMGCVTTRYVAVSFGK